MTPRAITPLAALLIASPLLQWALIATLSLFTPFEPPLGTLHGASLALALFLAPGNWIAMALGTGLVLRSEWTRRAALLVFAASVVMDLAVLALRLVRQPALDPDMLLQAIRIVVCAFYFVYLAAPAVRAAFHPLPAGTHSGATAAAAPVALPGPELEPEPVHYSDAMKFVARGQLVVGALALAATLYLAFAMTSGELLARGTRGLEADAILRPFVFVALAALIAPLALLTYASVGILQNRDRMRMSKRYAIITCWTMAFAAVLVLQLGESGLLNPGGRAARVVLALCAVSIAWQIVYLYTLRWFRSPR